MNIAEKDIELVAPNAEAASNGRNMVAKNKYANLCKSADDSLIFGECAGSGKNPYRCSVDYTDSSAPVYRCSCPSRQIPCKHVLGLMYAYSKGMSFNVADVPEDIATKRAKKTAVKEKKEKNAEEVKSKIKSGEVEAPSKAKLTSLKKKTEAQLEGINAAEKILKSIVHSGLSTLDAKSRKMYDEQVKQLGNYYITGIQSAFNDLFIEISEVKNDEYTVAIDKLNFLSALLKRSKAYLQTKVNNPETIELDSAIEEQIGYAWKLTELMQNGLWEENAELVQLAFYIHDDMARKEFVDEGFWLNLKSGKIYKTKNFRPYKAARYIKTDNSFTDVVKVSELYIYPGDINPRTRWDVANVRDITTPDLAKIQSFAVENYADLIKSVKGSIKNPLNDKNPVAIIKFSKATKTEDSLVLEDSFGNKLTLKNSPAYDNKLVEILSLFLPDKSNNICLTVVFNNDIVSGLFSACPVSIVTNKNIIKLLY